MDQANVRQCEEEYLKAARDLDLLDAEYSTEWLLNRFKSNSDQSATHATNASLAPYWNELRAKREIARMKLENAYGKAKEGTE